MTLTGVLVPGIQLWSYFTGRSDVDLSQSNIKKM